MKAMMSVEPGGPETLALTNLPTPEPGPGQVRIAVKAASVNFPDTLIIRDLYQFKPERPFAPGGEVSGVVEAVGEGVAAPRVGDRVIGLTIHGGFATHCILEANAVAPIPDGMPFDDAAALLLTFATSHHALKDRAHLQSGESLFILGAAGGVGSAAIELGKAMGARVIAGVSSAEKAAFCRELGADETLIYPAALDRDGQKALSKEIKAAVGGEGANVVYDAIGGDYTEPALRALAWTGRLLVVGFPAGIPRPPLNLALLKGGQIIGVFWGEFVVREPARHAANLQELFDLYAAGRIRPRITARFPLDQAATALEQLESRRALGKIMVTMA